MKNYTRYSAIIFMLVFVQIHILTSQSIQSLPIQVKHKIDPVLHQALIQKERNPELQIKTVESRTAGLRLSVSAGEAVGVLIKATSDINEYIRSIGGVIGSKHGNIYTAMIPMSAVGQVAQHSSVSYVEASRILYKSLDLSRAKTGADVLQSLPEPGKLTGKGVIIGFTDTGINTDHPNFKLPDGRTRILYIWDQCTDVGGNPPEGYDYGIEKDSADINAGRYSMLDGWQHGTHVSGIAAGNGGGSQYIGMAPEADIIMVADRGDALWDHGLTTIGTLDGYDYIRAKANALGKRHVINTSEGTNLGPHDGTTLFEQAVNADVAAGSIICLSAGNEANSSRHASAVITPSQPQEIITIITGVAGDPMPMDIWYKANDRLALRFGDGTDYITIPPVDTTVTFSTWYLDAVVTSIIGSPLNGDNEIYITFTLRIDEVGDDISLQFSAEDGNLLPDGGRVDLWWERNYYVYFDDHYDPSITVGMPACADAAITVASYNNRTFSYNPVDAISSFSGRGPRRDGALKPDIAGIGGMVTSSIGSSGYDTYSGTSMSSPHVAGAVALLLQQSPTLTNNQVKEKLFTSTTMDGYTGVVPNSTWGYGKLNVMKAAEYQDYPIMSVLKDTIQFRDYFVNMTIYDSVLIKNLSSRENLNINISTSDPIFSVNKTTMEILPLGQEQLVVGVTPTTSGDYSGLLTITSNDPLHPEKTIVLCGHSDYTPEIGVSPESFAVTVSQGGYVNSTLTIQNTGNGPLHWTNWNTNYSPTGSYGNYDNPYRDRSNDKIYEPTDFAEIGQLPKAGVNNILSLPIPQGNFIDGFEDGNYDAWINDGSSGIREVTNIAPAEGDYSFHNYESNLREHCKGISRNFEENYRPEYIGFYVKAGVAQSDAWSAYFRVDGNTTGQQAIYFFATEGGVFYLNYDVGGDASFIYNPYQWYHVEFKNIDWSNKIFDYYIDNQLIKADIPFRNAAAVNQFGRLYLYNVAYFSPAEAWWDGISIGAQASWITLNPSSGTVAPGATQQVTAKFDATYISPGDWNSIISISNNYPVNVPTNIPVSMHVIGKQVIVVEPDMLIAGEVYVGMSYVDTLKVKNIGSEELSVSNITSSLPEFTVNLTSFSIPPGGEQAVAVTFVPVDTVAYNGVLTITNDDILHPTVNVGLQGQGIYPSEIMVSPESISATLRPGEITTRTLTISNPGRGNLKFNAIIGSGRSVASNTSSPKTTTASSIAGSSIHPDAKFVPNQVLIKFTNGNYSAQAMSIRSQLGASVTKIFKRTRAELWTLTRTSVEDAIAMYKNNPQVKYIVPNYIRKTFDKTPNDPLFPCLWGMQKISAPAAWDRTTGTDIIIGDIDTGIDPNHTDLSANLWTNPGEIPNNGIDDDANGYIDDIHGWNFCNNSNDVYDEIGHGTHTAGTIAAVGNNGVGVTGVCWSAKIMALKIFDYRGYASDAGAIAAIEYATTMGARLTNNSWGGGPYSQALYDAIAESGDAGVLFVAAAGNDGKNTDNLPDYPSCFDLDNIISVAATNSTDEKPEWSNYGLVTVDLGAPGVNVYSTIPGNGYENHEGTSMAAPHVSGVVGLILSVNPLLSWMEVKDVILSSVDPVTSLNEKTVTGGRLNAANALQNTQTWITLNPKSGTVAPGASIDLTVTFDATNSDIGTYQATIVINNNDPVHNPKNVPLTMQVNGTIVIPVSAGGNIVSVPVHVSNPSVESVFPTVIGGVVYKYDTTSQSYVPVTTLEYGVGYWAYFLEAQDVVLTGSAIDSLLIPLCREWNIVGTISYPVATSQVTTDPPGVTLFWYGYEGSYFFPDVLYPGKGYWVITYPPTSCTIKLKKDASLPKRTALSSQGSNSLSASGFDKFTVSDGSGNRQSLYVANLEREPILTQMNLAMPPAFSEAKFDVRFESGEMIKVLSAKAQTELGIAVTTEASIIDLSWELKAENGFSYEIVTEGTQVAKEMSATGSMSITIPSDGKIRVRAIGSNKAMKSDLPGEYALHQNYPNPFNPVTTIKYQLPEKASVRLEVFNILGQRVAVLVNAEQEAGYYQMPFDAKALSSGIYFYRISAGSYVNSQKMMLLR